jgi:hypothetical protein
MSDKEAAKELAKLILVIDKKYPGNPDSPMEVVDWKRFVELATQIAGGK